MITKDRTCLFCKFPDGKLGDSDFNNRIVILTTKQSQRDT